MDSRAWSDGGEDIPVLEGSNKLLQLLNERRPDALQGRDVGSLNC